MPHWNLLSISAVLPHNPLI
uniref:Uncharacterized protein n=1 Tax=Arundo donax TaxID=35708 RepID=A0A0A9C3T5_ARUDO